MLDLIRPAIGLTIVMTVLTGMAYPLAMTGIAQTLFPARAEGSLAIRDGKAIGSALIGQEFSEARYLHPRPSAVGYDAAAAGASNLGPTSAELISAVNERRRVWETENGGAAPVDAVTTSASGLDPDISIDNALGQVERIAAARDISALDVERLLAEAVERPFLGLYGTVRVNVLAVNLALDKAYPVAPVQAK
ncbi:potassium-transporting ATPase subunit KdpC [Martelella endophytica]|uniref:Potassium-transporting ATPase KdpC subunit n=1 Tax=Martelella endophytica TaxID=1486262 RepID=A0A0D5LVF3_MAREN|nr:potassium-transporting ATPase subunit KdpC [Martelella endophytica]AJY48279.1 hypothetical protein TM49_16170 [Martelella endophytica]